MATSENSSSDPLLSGGVDEKVTGYVQFSKDEEALVVRMYKLVGARWALIAGRIPGRSAEEIEKYWTSHYLGNGSGEWKMMPSNV